MMLSSAPLMGICKQRGMLFSPVGASYSFICARKRGVKEGERERPGQTYLRTKEAGSCSHEQSALTPESPGGHIALQATRYKSKLKIQHKLPGRSVCTPWGSALMTGKWHSLQSGRLHPTQDPNGIECSSCRGQQGKKSPRSWLRWVRYRGLRSYSEARDA